MSWRQIPTGNWSRDIVSNHSTNNHSLETSHSDSCFDTDDHVPSTMSPMSSHSLLFPFEDNEALMKMSIEGRSPNVRHVARTHRVNLDWFFQRISLDPAISVRYVNTSEQMADVLTKGSSTVVRWHSSVHFIQKNRLAAILSSQTLEETKPFCQSKRKRYDSKFTSERSVPNEKQNLSQAQDHERPSAKNNLELISSKAATTKALSRVMLRVPSGSKKRIFSNVLRRVTFCSNRTKKSGKKSQISSGPVLERKNLKNDHATELIRAKCSMAWFSAIFNHGKKPKVLNSRNTRKFGPGTVQHRGFT